MPAPDDALIETALALSHARGAALLAMLGEFDVWHGDLAEMRRDSPRAGSRIEPERTTSKNLADVLLMARAIELLDGDGKERCRNRLIEILDRDV